MSARKWITLGALLAGLGVAAGAFGAHGLRGLVTPERISVFETAVRYHLIHSLALVLVGVVADRWSTKSFDWVGILFLVGIFLFSGSLYLLVLTDTPWLGAVTPFGGVSMIVGWALFGWAAWTSIKK
jgi:uncharacterized membrane protein YgdD (TMEM256/DUF423 family)